MAESPRGVTESNERPIPYGGQVLAMMVVHGVCAALASNSLTVSQFVVSEAPELDHLEVVFDLGLLLLLSVVAFAFWMLGRRSAFRRTILVYLVVSILTLVINTSDLVTTLTERPTDNAGAFALLWDAVVTWMQNVLTFAVCYWFLDQGGPDRRAGTNPGRADFGFPQQASPLPGWEGWKPGMLDYVFVAFTTSTAFSPTDTVVLSTWAKVLCMLQAGISLIIIAMLAARVVNTIQ